MPSDAFESQMLATIRERLMRFNPARIILFGSRARGQSTPDSDFDLLVVLDSCPEPRAAAIEMRRVLRDLPISKDIIVAGEDEVARSRAAVGSILAPALEEGRTIFERV